MDFSGERFIPGSTDLLAVEHMSRYQFAVRYAKGRSVLDIACGTGYGSRMLLDEGATAVLGVDVSDEAIAYAQTHYGDDPKLTFRTADAESFCSGKYDLIVSFETLEHLEWRNKFLKNLSTMINKEGMLIISTPNKAITSPMKAPNEIRNIYHKYEYVEGEFLAVLRDAGFRNIKKYGQHSYPAIFRVQPISRLLRRWIKDSVNTASVQPLIASRIPRYFVFTATK